MKVVGYEGYVDVQLDRVKWIWYLSLMRAAKVQASLCIRAVSPEPSLLAHTSSESRGTFRQKTRSLAPLNGWACAVKICHDGMLEDTKSLDAAQLVKNLVLNLYKMYCVFSSILLEVNDLKIVEMVTLTLKIPGKVPFLVGLVGAVQKLLTRCYAVSNLNSAEC